MLTDSARISIDNSETGQTAGSHGPVYSAHRDSQARTSDWSGLVYVAAWVIGLGLASSGPGAFDPAGEVHEYFVDHRSVALIQSLLVHGVAGVALIVFALALGRRFAGAAIGGSRNVTVASATAAAVVSFVQVALMVALYSHVGGGGANGSRSLFNAINKADRLKLVLLAVFVATASLAAVRLAALPRWISWVGAVLAPLLVLGGLAFVFDVAVFDVALLTALPVLLLCVGATNVTLLRRRSPLTTLS